MNRIKRAFYRLSIVTKIASTLFLISTVSILLATVLHMWQTKHEIDNLLNNFVAVSIHGNESFLYKSIFSDDRWALYKFIKSISGNDFVTEAGLIDPQGRVIVHTDTVRWKMDSPYHWPEGEEWTRLELSTAGEAVATVSIRKNQAYLNGLIKQILDRGVLIFLFTSALSVALGVFVSRRIVDRLRLLLSNIDAMLGKEWNKIGSVNFHEKDEITKILESFYAMAREQKEHIARIDETNAFYREILAKIETTILICDGAFKPIYSNKGQIGPNYRDAGLEALLGDNVLMTQLATLNHDENLQKELRIENRSRSRNLIVTVSRLDDRWLLTFANITRVRELEAQFMMAQSLSIVGELSAALSHELKNLILPLKLLIGHTGAVAGEDMQTIRIVTDKMNHLITSFLEFAKPPSQEARTQEQLSARIEEILKILSNRFIQRQIKLIRSVDRSILAQINPRAFEIVVINLLTNAIEASRAGSEITLALARAKGGFARLSVCDTGSGIDPAIQKRIHEPFFTTKKNGTGLGLSTVYRIVYDMGGYIELHSSQAGTTFDVFIPTQKEAA